MTFFIVMGGIILIGLGTTVALFRKGGVYNPDDEVFEALNASTTNSTPNPLPAPTVTETSPLEWATPKQAYHSTRVLCDELGLAFKDKNEVCATIYGESEFNNNAVCKNRNSKGEVTSSDWGICQINDYWHCGKGKTFPSAQYVVSNPEKAVRFMIKMYKAGKIDLWIAHKNGRYLQFLKKNSPMWKLAS